MKNPLGLQDRGKIEIECADCGKSLMIFQITKDNNDLVNDGKDAITNQILVKCGFCGGRSYSTTINGQFYPGLPNDDMYFEPISIEGVECDICFGVWPKK